MAVDLETQALVSQEYLEDIGDALRESSGSTRQYAPSEMATAILGITSQGTPQDVDFVEGDLVTLEDTSVTAIADVNVFKGLENGLQSVTLDNCVVVPNETFKSFTTLKTASFKSLLTIPYGLFWNCSNLISADVSKATALNARAFCNSGIRSISLDKVTVIYDTGVDGQGAFYNCSLLEDVTAPELVTIQNGRYNRSYREGSFAYCASLRTFDAPKLSFIGQGAFGYCSSLVSVDSQAISNIGETAFEGCSNLERIDCSLLTTFKDYAFYGCSSLVDIGSPVVTSVNQYAFFGCSSLADFDFSECTTIADHAFHDCASLDTLDAPKLTSIGIGAFYNCSALASISFANAVSIGAGAFYNTGLTGTVTLPKVERIDSANAVGGAFNGTKVEKFVFPELTQVTTGGNEAWEGAFANNPYLEEVDAPYLTLIGMYTFYACSALTKVTAALQTIHACAFEGCTHLNDIDLTDATLIAYRAFYGCRALTALNAPNVLTIEYNAFYQSGVSSVSLPRCQTIGASAFYGTALSGTVTLPALETIQTAYNLNGAFRELSITKFVAPELITIGDGADSYDNGAFYNCLQLEEVDAPKLEHVAGYSFEDCAVLTKVNSRVIKYIGSNAFRNCRNLSDIDFPELTLLGHQSLQNCVSLPSSLTFPKVLESWGYALSGCDQFTDLSFPELLRMKDSAFRGMLALKTFSAPKCVTAESSIFYQDSGLQSVNLPQLQSVLPQSFTSCTSLSSVNLDSAQSVGGAAFSGCTSLTAISLPECRTITGSAFAGSGLVGTVALPKVVSIYQEALYGDWRGAFAATAITSVSLPECAVLGLTTSGGDPTVTDRGVFSFCAQLASVNIPKVVRIGNYCFYNCTALTSIDIPSTCNTIGANAFQGCTNLTQININRASGAISGAPWGATNAVINWTGSN